MTDKASEFKTVFSDTKGSDAFYRFLQVVFNLFPEDKFHLLIKETTEKGTTDEEIYKTVQSKLPSIKPFLSELTYSLPALKKQKREMTKQALQLLDKRNSINGYVEIGSTGRYISSLRKEIKVAGNIFIINDFAPNNSIAEIMERGQIAKIGTYINLNHYAPINEKDIPSESVDLVTCHIGLHHCPVEKLQAFIQSINRILRKGGAFILRDHDVKNENMVAFCALVHTVFNLGTNVKWETNANEFRSFKPVEEWSKLVSQYGFTDSGKRILQDKDPSDNTLMQFIKQ